MIVIDANIFNKLFLSEADSPQALQFFDHAAAHDMALVAPSLFRYEVWESARRNTFPLLEIDNLIKLHERLNLKLITPNTKHLLKAEEIAAHGTKNSGFPSMYDSIYHAIALVEGGQFLTADKKHAAKVQKFGRLVLLENWERLLK